jgi:PPOX class probable F420-dependent enzyme
MSRFSSLSDEKYINLETFRHDGRGVRTPVWFAVDPNEDAVLYVYTVASSGKVKRLRRSARARIAPCNAGGRVHGEWLDVRAERVGGSAFVRGMRLLDRKYWPWKQMLAMASRLSRSGERVVIAIRPAK